MRLRAAALLLICAVACPDRAPAADDGRTPVLALGGYWRQSVSRMPPLISQAEAKNAGVEADEKSRELTLRHMGRNEAQTVNAPSDLPPDDWRDVDFDDSSWVRVRGDFLTDRQEVGLVCRRARFRVSDPAKVAELSLRLAYRGGVVVYLNGAEVLRTGMPAGQITPRTPAEDYPLGAFLVTDGPRRGKPLHWWDDRDRTDQFALRERKAEAVPLPTRLLRQGTNVLAVELHAAQFPAACRTAGMGDFAPIGLRRLMLEAAAADGAIEPNIVRPSGLHVANADVTDEIFDSSWADRCEPLRPIRIVAVRNGRFAGQVVVSSDAAIEGLAARIGGLRRAEGGSIPASAVQITYAIPGQGPVTHDGGTVYGGPDGPSLTGQFRRMDALLDAAPAAVPLRGKGEGRLDANLRAAWGLPATPRAGAVAPVRLTVAVPADAAAGRYQGELSIQAKDAEPVRVPVELEVFAYTLPAAKDYVGRISIYQSPDTLAAMYKVPLWSEEHWRLIERSVRLIGEAGNHTILLPLLSKEQVGNEQSYVTWVPKTGGGFTYDTAVMDRYLELFLKYHDPGRIAAVCCIVWGNEGQPQGNPYLAEKYDAQGLPAVPTRGEFTVTTVDPATGEKTDMPLPKVGSKQYEQFWRPVLLRVREHLKQRGLERAMCYGMPADPRPIVAAVGALHDIAPDVGWFVGNHPGATAYGYDLADRSKTVPVVHCERVYTSALADPAVKRAFGWRRKDMTLAFNRYGFGPLCLYPEPGVYAFRLLMEADLASGHRGAGRIGADYFQMAGGSDASGGGGTFYARYPKSAVGQTGMGANCRALLAPGPDGPVTSMRFENVREGQETAEVVVFLQNAVLSGTLPGDLAARCQAALDERVNAMRIYPQGFGRRGWQERDRRLFSLAAEAAAAGPSERP